jgi:O-antigen ligase
MKWLFSSVLVGISLFSGIAYAVYYSPFTAFEGPVQGFNPEPLAVFATGCVMIGLAGLLRRKNPQKGADDDVLKV